MNWIKNNQFITLLIAVMFGFCNLICDNIVVNE